METHQKKSCGEWFSTILRKIGFTNLMAAAIVLMIAGGLFGGFVLAVLSIITKYTGALACWTAAFGPIGTAASIVLVFTVNKSKAENTSADGKGIKYAAAEGQNFANQSEQSPMI